MRAFRQLLTPLLLFGALIASGQIGPKPAVRDGLVTFQGLSASSIFEPAEEARLEAVLQALTTQAPHKLPWSLWIPARMTSITRQHSH